MDHPDEAAEWPFPGLGRGIYRCLYIDPPWYYSGGKAGRPQHYPRMKDAELATLPVRDLVHPDGALLFMWVTSPKMEHALRLARAWGFRLSGRAFVWVKTHRRFDAGSPPLFLPRDGFHTGTGYTTRKNAEDVLLFKVGRRPPRRLRKDIPELIISPLREHSRKPDVTAERIETYCEGPRAELFARTRREGWDAWGNETSKFGREAA